MTLFRSARAVVWTAVVLVVLLPGNAIAATVSALGLPDVAVWFDEPARTKAVLPDGLDWPIDKLTAVAETNGRFADPGGWNTVLRRIGAVSQQQQIRYWSQSRNRWRDLFADAAALSGPDPEMVRDDFTPDDLQPGRVLYLKQRPNGASQDAVLRLSIVERSPERLVINFENDDGAPFPVLLTVQASLTRLALVIEREPDGAFRYQSVMGADLNPGRLLRDTASKSLIHRAVAMYRYVAGIPTDQEPPAS